MSGQFVGGAKWYKTTFTFSLDSIPQFLFFGQQHTYTHIYINIIQSYYTTLISSGKTTHVTLPKPSHSTNSGEFSLIQTNLDL